jgi:predicted signal transduction protein with EAL and GGDEF domain
MYALNDIGVRFSLEYFVTSYSSLKCLNLMPLAQLKIDQPFVLDLDTDQSDSLIVRTIIAMSNRLKMNAKGVETEVWRQLLLGEGCH